MGTGADTLVLANIGTAHLALNELEEALTHLNLSLPVARQIHDKQLEATILSNLTVAWHKLGKPEVAIFYGKESINLFQELRGFIQSLDQATQRNYLKTVEVSYRFVAFELINAQRFAEAQQVLNFYKDQRWLDTFHTESKSSPRLSFTPQEKEMFEQYEARGPFPIETEIPKSLRATQCIRH